MESAWVEEMTNDVRWRSAGWGGWMVGNGIGPCAGRGARAGVSADVMQCVRKGVRTWVGVRGSESDDVYDTEAGTCEFCTLGRTNDLQRWVSIGYR